MGSALVVAEACLKAERQQGRTRWIASGLVEAERRPTVWRTRRAAGRANIVKRKEEVVRGKCSDQRGRGARPSEAAQPRGQGGLHT